MSKSFLYKREFFPLMVSVIVLSTSILILFLFFSLENYWNWSSTAQGEAVLLISLFFCFIILNAILIIRLFFFNIIYIDQALKEAQQDCKGSDENYVAQSFAEHASMIIDYLSTAKQKEMSIELLQKQADLDAMQRNINPHFLYNTLDSIRGTAQQEHAEKTASIIESLSVFFRYTISQTNDILSLEQELRNVNTYVQIQQYRFNNRFSLQILIDENDSKLMLYKIPKLTLQPIVENAINHGLESITHDGKIIIKVYTTQSRLVISIADNGVGISPEKVRIINKNLHSKQTSALTNPSQRGVGMALQNVNARIKILFGEKYGLSVSSTMGFGTEVNIALPLFLNHNEI